MNNYYKEKVKKLLISIKNNLNDKDIFMKKLHHCNSSKLINFLIEIIDEEIISFSYDNNNDISYLLYALELLDEYILIDTYKDTITNYLNKIYPELGRLAILKEKHNSKIANKKYKSLLLLLDKIENKMDNYTPIINNNNLNEQDIISYTIFQLKSFSALDKIIKNSPNIINSTNDKGIPIIKKVIFHYLIALKRYIGNGKKEDLIYYDKVFRRLIIDPNLRLSEVDKNDLITKITNYIDKIKIDETIKLEELTYYQNKLILSILGDFEEDTSIKNLNYEYGIRQGFNPAIESETKRLYILHKNIEETKNTRNIYTFDHNPNEIDDGVSIIEEDGKLIIGIHIANPLSILNNNSIIIKEARKRTESLYFTHNNKSIVYPLLHDTLTKQLMGLNENINIHRMSFYYTFDILTGDLIKQEIKPEIIKVTKNLDYEDFGKIIKNGTDEGMIKELINIEKVASFMKREYDDTIVKELVGPQSKSSRGINTITNLMIGNNIYVARLFKTRGLPFTYRNHKLDQNKKDIEKLKNKISPRNPVTSIFKLLEELENISPNASYSPICLGHDTLNSKEYSHTTSPLRRFIDILNMMCINKFILGTYTEEDIKIYTEIIYRITEEVNSKRIIHMSYSKEYERRLALI